MSDWPPKYTESQMATRRAFVEKTLSNMDLSIPGDENSHVPFSEFPQAQATADLEALKMRAGRTIPVSDSLRKKMSEGEET